MGSHVHSPESEGARAPAAWWSWVRLALLWTACASALGIAAWREVSVPSVGDGIRGPAGMVWIPGGELRMGDDLELVHGFWMDRRPVTNAQFGRFVRETRYVTTAERRPECETLRVQAPGRPTVSDLSRVPGGMVFVGSSASASLEDPARGWRFVPGASWRHPEGPDSSVEGKDEQPVVQVSYEDALAYAKWSGKRLPTEAEWAFAVRAPDGSGLQDMTDPASQWVADGYRGDDPQIPRSHLGFRLVLSRQDWERTRQRAGSDRWTCSPY